MSAKASHELNQLKSILENWENTKEKVDFLIPYLSPHIHSSAVGLWATRELSKLILPFQTLTL